MTQQTTIAIAALGAAALLLSSSNKNNKKSTSTKNRKSNMKIPFLAIAALIATVTVCAVTGCKTTTTPVVTNGVTNFVTTTTLAGVTITPTGVYNTLRGGTSTGARIAMKADTNSVAYLQALRVVLGDAISSTNYDPAALAAAVNALPISSIHNATAVEAIQGGFAAFEVLEPIIDAKIGTQNQFLKPALQGVYDGIGDALGIVAPPLPVTGYEMRIVVPAEVYGKLNAWQAKYPKCDPLTAALLLDAVVK